MTQTFEWISRLTLTKDSSCRYRFSVEPKGDLGENNCHYAWQVSLNHKIANLSLQVEVSSHNNIFSWKVKKTISMGHLTLRMLFQRFPISSEVLEVRHILSLFMWHLVPREKSFEKRKIRNSFNTHQNGSKDEKEVWDNLSTQHSCIIYVSAKSDHVFMFSEWL